MLLRNGFTITYSSDFYANGNIVATNCVQGTAHYLDIRVSVTMPTDTSFLHFVYQGPVQNTVDAITRVFPREPIAAGYSIVSLEDECSGSDKGTRFSGTSDVTLEDGGIFSNSCIISDGSSGSVIIDPGPANYDGRDFSFDPHGFPIISPDPLPVTYDYKPIFDFPGGCTGAVNPSPILSGTIFTYSPGRYTEDISLTNSDNTVFLKPGLYCFDDGAGFKATGGNLSLAPGYANADGGIDGVSFYFTNDGGGFDTNGNAKVTLLAPIEPCTGNETCSPAVPNILIYMEKGNTNDITLGGNSKSYYEGTVYAETAAVQVGGTASELSSVGVQVIADSVRVHGTVAMNITYDNSKVYHTTNKINLEK